MSHIVFLAPVPDPSVSTTIYGKGHQTSAITDETQIRAWMTDGKVAYHGLAPRNPRVTALGTTTATIAWEGDGVWTSSQVQSGTTTAYGTNTAGSPATGGGTVTASLSGLTTATTYHYRVQVVTGSYTTSTPDFTFRTN